MFHSEDVKLNHVNILIFSPVLSLHGNISQKGMANPNLHFKTEYLKTKSPNHPNVVFSP